VNDIRLTLKLTPAQAEAVATCRKGDGGIKDFDALKKCPGLEAAKLDPLKIAVRF
jgi:hypothetical protein